MRVEANPYEHWLQKVNQSGGPPRRLPPHKFYKQQATHKPKIDQLFKERWPEGMANTDMELAERVSIAKELWEKEPKGVQDSLIVELNAAFAAATKRYEGVASAVENPDPVSVQQ